MTRRTFEELWAEGAFLEKNLLPHQTRRERGLKITCAVLLACVAMLGLALALC